MRSFAPPTVRRLAAPIGFLFLLASPALSETFTNFESHQVHPLALSADGSRLFAVNTPDNRLTVFAVTAGGLTIEAEIPVGLEPVSVRPRTPNEVWVVNHLSDDVSVVDLTTMNVRATIPVGDEPADVVFAGTAGRAFVTVSQEDAVKIFDPADLGAPPTVVPVFMNDPRALALRPDGIKVYAASFKSGNATSILSENEVVAGGGPPGPQPPMNPALPPAPDVGLIVFWNGAHWLDETGTKNWETFVPIPYTMADNDVAELDANAASPVPRYLKRLGTLNYNLTVRPTNGFLYIPNVEALNLTRFEPNQRGRFARNRISIMNPAVIGAPTIVHLNPHIDYGVSPGPPSEVAMSLSQPNGGDWDAAGQNLYLAAIGSDKIAVLDPAGNVTARIDVGGGPTAAEVDDANGRVYVLERFTNTVGIVSTATLAKSDEIGLGFQPEPAAVTEGRRFLYDATLSAHGELACASCHTFGQFDDIAWDLGDPESEMEPSGQLGIPDFHPMKGPMVTQSLRGLAATEPLHWRGDRTDFARFNPAFQNLMGSADTLSTSEMQSFTDFIMTIVYPPNPNMNLDRTYPDPAPPAGSAERGRVEFTSNPHAGPLRCQQCHESDPPGEPMRVSPGTNRLLIPAEALEESQAFKVAQLRGLYEKIGWLDAPGSQKRGFGFIHDGAIDNLFNFLTLPVFQFADDQQRRDVEAFVLAFDTGTAPAVGAQQTVDAANKTNPAVVSRIALFMSQADAGNVDLVAKGRVDGLARGYLYAGGGLFESDRASEGTIAESALRDEAGAGSELTFTAVPPGSGERIGIDRDSDGHRDRDEIDVGSDPADPNSTPTVAVNDPGPGASIFLAPGKPNPAGAGGTEISFSVARPSVTSVRIFDVQGREVTTVLAEKRRQGTVSARWDGRDSAGRPAPSGVYFVRLQAGGAFRTRSVTLIR